jgi:hypothetical protein
MSKGENLKFMSNSPADTAASICVSLGNVDLICLKFLAMFPVLTSTHVGLIPG